MLAILLIALSLGLSNFAASIGIGGTDMLTAGHPGHLPSHTTSCAFGGLRRAQALTCSGSVGTTTLDYDAGLPIVR